MGTPLKLLNMHCRVCGQAHVEEFLNLGDQPHCIRSLDLTVRRIAFVTRFTCSVVKQRGATPVRPPPSSTARA